MAPKAGRGHRAHLCARRLSGDADSGRAAELLAPVQLNIVCFRYRAAEANKVNGEIVIDIQESGIAAPSTTLLDGKLAIRGAIVDHRTDTCDIDALISAGLDFGARRSRSDDGLLPTVEPSRPLAM
jgi:aromatic-L-amino-acid decarboxylase